ncbi:uncharacterized protein EV422DRAFT_541267 [Fimicolochytrium jonesii]|uniref:uncharacterized protein n=1 Tax=Fimicolochytrium jonesii TaxID=1396493 RepID=UPI0022FE7FCE|nr:uncharacterized protein EV422DRAFT_541267 [Fimicolochytrium jonesii]KAI8817583.1 hypothetical protein EV422DRAFT_541267 [Fimicolochytrium jonesii]
MADPNRPAPGRVFIPPRRNVPARASTSSSRENSYSGDYGSGTPVSAPLMNTSGGAPPLPGRAATYNPSGPHIPQRAPSGSGPSIPSRSASAQGLPERTASIANRNSFMPPPRRVTANSQTQDAQRYAAQQTTSPQLSYEQQPPLQLMPGLSMGYPGGPEPQPGYPQPLAFPSPDGMGQRPVAGFSQAPVPQQYAMAYAPPYSAPNTNPYGQPSELFPEPAPILENFITTESRRPQSLYSESNRLNTVQQHRLSLSEISPVSFGEGSQPDLQRTSTENSLNIPPRSGGFTIPLRNASVNRPNIDTLLDEGATAFALPRHNVDEALGKWRQARELALRENDMLREAKALSNIGCALRNLGRLRESLDELRQAWDISTRYVEEHARTTNSLWLQLVMRHADIDSDVEEDDPIPVLTSDNAANGESHDPSQGPPIVVWFLQLTTNLGNAHYCLGQYQEAIQYHDMCKRLAEAVLEEYPLPPQFTLGTLQRTNISTASLKSAAGREEGDSESNRGSTGELGPSTKTKIKLSYLHRQTLIAETRSLTHLGLCYQQLGLDDEALSTHKQAETIVSFYSARLLLNTTSTRRASLSNPNDIFTAVSSAEAGIVANLGTAHHAKGHIHTATDYHSRAAKLFSNIGDQLGKAKQDANLGCLSIEVGKLVNNLQWAHEVNLAHQRNPANLVAKLNTCRQFWGPPRLETINWGVGAPDEDAPEILGQPLFDEGILALYEIEKVFRRKQDWLGRDFVWANLAVGYVLLHQPYLALYYLSRLAPEVPADGTNPTTGLFSPDASNAYGTKAISPFLYPHVYFTLTQALFLLTRLMQATPGRPLFPQPGDGYLDHGTGLPVMDPEPVSRFLKAMHLEKLTPDTINDEKVMELLVNCREVLDGIVGARTQATATMMFALSGSGSTVGLDAIRQKSVLTTATCAKMGYLLADGPVDVPEVFKRLYVDDGNRALSRCAKEILGKAGLSPSFGEPIATQAWDGSSPSGPPIDGPVTPFLAISDRILSAPRNAIETDSVKSQSTSSRSSLYVGGGAIAADSLEGQPAVLGTLLGITADLISFAVSNRSKTQGTSLDLPSLLGCPPEIDIFETRKRLLHAAMHVYGSAIGLCPACAEKLIPAVEQARAPIEGETPQDEFHEGADIVFVKMSERDKRDPNFAPTGHSSPAIVYPCRHYSWPK